MKIAYLPFLGGSADLGARLLEPAIGHPVRGFEFLRGESMDTPVHRALNWGADVLIGHSLGAYALVLAGEFIEGKKLALIDGGHDSFDREAVMNLGMADAERACEGRGPEEWNPEQWLAAVRKIGAVSWDTMLLNVAKRNQLLLLVPGQVPVKVEQEVLNGQLHSLQLGTLARIAEVIRQSLLEAKTSTVT